MAMRKDNRKSYLQTWLGYLKGKTEIQVKDLYKLLEKKYKNSYSTSTLRRYNATLLGNLMENGYLSGKKGRGASGGPLTIVKEITMPVLNKCLSRDFKKVRFEEKDLPQIIKQPAAPGSGKIRRKTAEKTGRKAKAQSAKEKIPAGKKAGMPARRAPKEEVKEAELTTLFYAQQLAEQIAEMENRLAAYERIFMNLRQLFAQEIQDMDEWFAEVFR
jgi:hypothetical protein